MNKNNIIKCKNKYLAFSFLLFIFGLLFLFNTNNTALAAYNGSFVNSSTPYAGGGCYMQVYNTRTGKYYAGIYNSDWDSDIVIENDDFRHDDVLECDAYTCYAYGSYWVYKGDSLATLTRDAYYKESDRYVDHLNFTVRITSKVTKVSCSATYNSTMGEQLSVTIYSASDSIIPQVYLDSERPDDSKVLIGHNITITGTDNIKVKGWKVTDNSVKSPDGFTDFAGSPATTKSYSYICNTSGIFYAWVIDIYGNVSDYARFNVGTSPTGTISAPSAQVGETVRYSVSVSSGTTPYRYQWYIGAPEPAVRETTFDDWTVEGGSPYFYKVEGATNSYYSYEAVQNHYNKYVLCAIDNGYDVVFISQKMEIKFAPEVNATVSPAVEDSTTGGIQTAHVKKGGKAVLFANIILHGDPDDYTFQWYSAGSSTSVGNAIPGATDSIYEVIPRNTQTTYYYCRISNGIYAETNRVCVRSDVTEPIIDKGDFEENIYVNESVAINIPLIVTSTGYGFNKDNFVASDVRVLVKESGLSPLEVTPSVKELTYDEDNSTETDYHYNLKLEGIPENGKLSLLIAANSFQDEFGNGNAKTEIFTNITVDNVEPVIKFSKILSGVEIDPSYTGDYYISSSEKDLVIELYVEEGVAYDTSEFTAADIGLKVGTSLLGSAYSKSLQFSYREDTRYYYKLTLSRISGNGQLYVYVDSNKVKDKATNGNATKRPEEKNIEIKNIRIDNTNPAIQSIRMNLGNPSGPEYLGSADTSWHKGWTNNSVYITVVATDSSLIDYYTVSKDNKSTFTRLAGNQDRIDSDYNGTVYYRVYDKAGNMFETGCDVKIDMTKPAPTKVLLHEERENGSLYVYNSVKPTNKSIYTNADTPKDTGNTNLQ